MTRRQRYTSNCTSSGYLVYTTAFVTLCDSFFLCNIIVSFLRFFFLYFFLLYLFRFFLLYLFRFFRGLLWFYWFFFNRLWFFLFFNYFALNIGSGLWCRRGLFNWRSSLFADGRVLFAALEPTRNPEGRKKVMRKTK